ncbi:hypothetical protein J437_LFUL017135 [Ladona fulva]|uniref:Uncharacterized protein n=1 Tax=Ladona fulva TaxID=123851 RepID=A0A8K0KS06_LADFU|nr:hypothetical protein J437_LFUL017135 [Ladona fulva]
MIQTLFQKMKITLRKHFLNSAINSKWSILESAEEFHRNWLINLKLQNIIHSYHSCSAPKNFALKFICIFLWFAGNEVASCRNSDVQEKVCIEQYFREKQFLGIVGITDPDSYLDRKYFYSIQMCLTYIPHDQFMDDTLSEDNNFICRLKLFVIIGKLCSRQSGFEGISSL